MSAAAFERSAIALSNSRTRDVAMAAVPVEADVLGVPCDAAAEDLDGFPEAAQVRRPPAQPDDVVRVVRVLHEVGGGLRQVLFEGLAALPAARSGANRGRPSSEVASGFGPATAPPRPARLQVSVVPGDGALVAVLLVARGFDGMALPGVDDELGLLPQPAERLVELLGVDQGHVHVVLPAEDEGGSRDLLDREPGRQAFNQRSAFCQGRPSSVSHSYW